MFSRRFACSSPPPPPPPPPGGGGGVSGGGGGGAPPGPPRTCDIAAMLCVSERKVDRIKKKFVQEGLDLTLNRQPSKCDYDLKIDGRLEAQLLAMSCSAPPEGQARWSLRLLADRLVELELVGSVSHETVRRALKKTNSSRGGKSAG